MQKLTINKSRYSSGMDTLTITGFEDGELAELKSMKHEDAKEKLIAMLDSRNGNMGTCYACGYGIYGLWFDNEAAYMNVGNSCD